MCNFWSCILTREGKVVWDKDATSHEDLIKRAGLVDGKLEDRDFVRLEITPKILASKRKSDWVFKVDEEMISDLECKTCGGRAFLFRWSYATEAEAVMLEVAHDGYGFCLEDALVRCAGCGKENHYALESFLGVKKRKAGALR